MAPGGVEPPHADSKSAALSAELRGRARFSVALWLSGLGGRLVRSAGVFASSKSAWLVSADRQNSHLRLAHGRRRALTSCGGDSTASGTVADTDTITILQTDIEAQPMGEGQACIEKLTKLVTADYLAEHDLPVEDEASAAIPIQNAIVNSAKSARPTKSFLRLPTRSSTQLRTSWRATKPLSAEPVLTPCPG
jgi:hypothetical protein